MQKEHLFWADNLKGFLILLVILGHVWQYYNPAYIESHLYNYIYAFHMPAFMALSGFLSHKPAEDAKDWSRLKNRATQLLLPYLIWTPIYCFIINKPVWEGFLQSPVYWFLILLFIISILTTFCQWLAYRYKQKSIIFSLVMLVVLFVTVSFIKTNILSLKICHVHFFFYSLGWYLKEYEYQYLRRWMVIPAGVFFAILGYYYRPGVTPSLLYQIPPAVYFIFSGTSGIIFFIMLFRFLFKSESKILSLLGRSTLGIYVIHLVLCVAAVPYVQFFMSKVGYTVGLTSIFIVLVLFSTAFTKYMEKNKILCLAVGK